MHNLWSKVHLFNPISYKINYNLSVKYLLFNGFYLPFTAPPRFDVPQNYTDGLIFRHEEVMRLKVPLVAKPAARVSLLNKQYIQNWIYSHLYDQKTFTSSKRLFVSIKISRSFGFSKMSRSLLDLTWWLKLQIPTHHSEFRLHVIVI